MIEASRKRDALVRSILTWAGGQNVKALAPHFALGTDDRERSLLAALGGLAGVVSATTRRTSSEVPLDVSDWWYNGPLPPKELAEEVRRAMQSGRNLFGELYTAVVSNPHRRRLGTVFTPPAVTDHMLSQCKEYGLEPEVVIDPGAGVGAFTLDAANRWGVPVVAVDLNVATLGFLAARCHFVGLETSILLPEIGGKKAQRSTIHFVQGDFLEWLPDGLSQTRSPALIIGNPPYTRHQGMDPELKEIAREAAGHLVPSGLAGMAAYFLAASLRQLRPKDALCMILPGSWLHARYGSGIRRYVWGLTHRRIQLSVFPHRTKVFPQSQVDAVVLFVGPQEEEPCPFILAEASFKSDEVKTSRTQTIDRSPEQPSIFPRTMRDLNRRRKYSKKLRDFYRIRRGIATGRNAFFLLTDAEVENHQIPASALVPTIGSVKDLDVDTIDVDTFERLHERDLKRWLLMLRPEDLTTPAIREYIELGVRQGVHSGFLASHRRHWFAVEDIAPAPLLLLPMSSREFRVIRNTRGVRHTNNFYGLYPLTDKVDMDRAARWLRSRDGQRELRRVANRYGGGMLKLEPRMVGDVEVPESFGRV